MKRLLAIWFSALCFSFLLITLPSSAYADDEESTPAERAGEIAGEVVEEAVKAPVTIIVCVGYGLCWIVDEIPGTGDVGDAVGDFGDGFADSWFN